MKPSMKARIRRAIKLREADLATTREWHARYVQNNDSINAAQWHAQIVFYEQQIAAMREVLADA